ncbi:MAG: carotenoid biosynthesis protein [Verrucomicrobiota bacterium]
MSAATPDRNQLEATPSDQLFVWSTRIAAGLALLSFLLVLGQIVTQTPLLGRAGRAEALLVVATAISTLLVQAKQLPGHKVLLTATIVAVLGGGIHAIGRATSMPFGPFSYAEAIGPVWFSSLAWPMPALWIIVVFNARGVARLGLKPWRKTKTYGFWVIGVATVLAVLFSLALDVFATKVTHFWIWLPTKFAFTWHGMPWTNALGWALGTLVLLAFATPFMINKSSRSRRLPPDYHPLLVWVLLLGLFGTGAALERLWSAAALCAVTAILSAGFAIRGARW